ncbi:unnamed protein product [Prorocentrum cordatum]|uniref:Uncharacterized protein n=1 Tax=Prorocentrum cordatum TaxID=2364126 RepID=A0ABN9SF90_9DINO|nr:unnamed protein product [Polarella glacialis]
MTALGVSEGFTGTSTLSIVGWGCSAAGYFQIQVASSAGQSGWPRAPTCSMQRAGWPRERMLSQQGERACEDGAGLEILRPSPKVAGWSVVIGDCSGEVVSALFGVVALAEGLDHVARDGGDFQFLTPPRNAAAVPGVTVHIDCSGALGCAGLLGNSASSWASEQGARWRGKIGGRFQGVKLEKVSSQMPHYAV